MTVIIFILHYTIPTAVRFLFKIRLKDAPLLARTLACCCLGIIFTRILGITGTDILPFPVLPALGIYIIFSYEKKRNNLITEILQEPVICPALVIFYGSAKGSSYFAFFKVQYGHQLFGNFEQFKGDVLMDKWYKNQMFKDLILPFVVFPVADASISSYMKISHLHSDPIATFFCLLILSYMIFACHYAVPVFIRFVCHKRLKGWKLYTVTFLLCMLGVLISRLTGLLPDTSSPLPLPPLLGIYLILDSGFDF